MIELPEFEDYQMPEETRPTPVYPDDASPWLKVLLVTTLTALTLLFVTTCVFIMMLMWSNMS